MVVDVHTHAFPDDIAWRAMKRLEGGGSRAQHDGTISGLLRTMDQAGIDKSVLCSIATKPSQFDPILKWSLQIASERIVPLASIHPQDPLMEDHMKAVEESGLRGIKIHPYYQGFDLLSDVAQQLLAAAERRNLVVVSHTGFDSGFPRDRIADPTRTKKITELFPKLRFVATHFGAWEDWQEVSTCLIGKQVYMETSFVLESLPACRVKEMIESHPSHCVMFGSDSPWTDSGKALSLLRATGLSADLLHRIVWENAAALFDF